MGNILTYGQISDQANRNLIWQNIVFVLRINAVYQKILEFIQKSLLINQDIYILYIIEMDWSFLDMLTMIAGEDRAYKVFII